MTPQANLQAALLYPEEPPAGGRFPRAGEEPDAAPAAAIPLPTRGSAAARDSSELPAPTGWPPPAWQPALDRWFLGILLPLATLAAALAAWSIVRAEFAPELPTVGAIWIRAVEVFSAPLRDAGPNDKGIAWQLLYSLGRVGAGFLVAVVVGLPVGFMLGMSALCRAAWMPLIQVLRPVSPLAWLPIGLLLFKAVNPSAVFVIAITSIWPIILNVAAGVQSVPQDYLNVAAILRLGRLERVRRIMLPATLPFVITGMRLSLGTAWMVIVAAEMLTGGIGIGFYVWDEWNNLNIASIVVAIGVIGGVGIVLDSGMSLLQRRLAYTHI